jgi:peptidoglycan-associated lipoprotein
MKNIFHAKFLITVGAALILSACANMGNTGRDDAPVMTDPVENIAPPMPMMPVVVDRLDPLSQEALNQVMGGMGGATVNFAYDRYDVDAAARSILQAQATWMKANNVNVIVEGHCDERGTREYNIALGDRRANAVKNYLVAMGVSGSRVRTVSYGKERPVGTDQDANRRRYTRVN